MNQMHDLMVGKLCYLVAVSGQLKIDDKDPKPADFLITKREFSNTEEFDTPEQIAQKLSMM